jgi:hypothetical protein
MKKISITLLTALMMIPMSVLLYSQTYINKTFDKGRLMVPQEAQTGSASFNKLDNEATFRTGSNVFLSGSSGSSQTTKKFVPLSGNPNIRIRLFKKDTNSSFVKQWVRSYSQIKIPLGANEPDSGKISFSLTDAEQVLPSRYNYFLLFYRDGQEHLGSMWSEEFMGQDALGIPIGTIFPVMGGNDAYFSAMESQGWYLCNGRDINTLDELEPKEKDTLVKIMIEGGSPNWWKLPDLRGMFLRGATNSSSQDPNYADRSAIASGTYLVPNWFTFVGGTPWGATLFNVGDKKLGSTQSADVGVHGHTGSTGSAGNHNHGGTTGAASTSLNSQESVSNASPTNATVNGTDSNSDHYHSISWDGSHTHSVIINNSTGTETRPKNVYVQYIMKCRR